MLRCLSAIVFWPCHLTPLDSPVAERMPIGPGPTPLEAWHGMDWIDWMIGMAMYGRCGVADCEWKFKQCGNAAGMCNFQAVGHRSYQKHRLNISSGVLDTESRRSGRMRRWRNMMKPDSMKDASCSKCRISDGVWTSSSELTCSDFNSLLELIDFLHEGLQS